jgi:hypothetical protein
LLATGAIGASAASPASVIAGTSAAESPGRIDSTRLPTVATALGSAAAGGGASRLRRLHRAQPAGLRE